MITAKIKRDSPRYGTWIRTFATDEVAIVSEPYLNEHNRARMDVDVSRLDSNQRYMLACMIARQRRVHAEVVLPMIEKSGRATISADDCEIGTRMEQEALFG